MRIWMCFALVASLGCKSSDAPVAATGSGVPPVATGSASIAGEVKLFINDAVVATVTAKNLGAWPRLDSLLPANARRMGTWQTLSIKGASDKATDINRPGDTHREQVLALFIDKQGAPAFGIFDPVELAKRGEPALRVDALREVRLKMDVEGGRGQNDHGSAAAEDPTKLKISFKTPQGETIMTGDQLLALPREEGPGMDAKGWKLTALLTAMKVTTYEKLRLSDGADMSLSVERKDFDDKTTIPFIKLNKQGSLRFRIYTKAGEGWKSTGDLRSLTTIEVVK